MRSCIIALQPKLTSSLCSLLCLDLLCLQANMQLAVVAADDGEQSQPKEKNYRQVGVVQGIGHHSKQQALGVSYCAVAAKTRQHSNILQVHGAHMEVQPFENHSQSLTHKQFSHLLWYKQ